ncbi:MAG: hypothetical protein ACH350_00675 [Parachlamydiaceae bacterium]
MIEQFVRSASGHLVEENRTIKTILQPQKVVGFEFDPHAPTYCPGFFSG